MQTAAHRAFSRLFRAPRRGWHRFLGTAGPRAGLTSTSPLSVISPFRSCRPRHSVSIIWWLRGNVFRAGPPRVVDARMCAQVSSSKSHPHSGAERRERRELPEQVHPAPALLHITSYVFLRHSAPHAAGCHQLHLRVFRGRGDDPWRSRAVEVRTATGAARANGQILVRGIGSDWAMRARPCSCCKGRAPPFPRPVAG